MPVVQTMDITISVSAARWSCCPAFSVSALLREIVSTAGHPTQPGSTFRFNHHGLNIGAITAKSMYRQLPGPSLRSCTARPIRLGSSRAIGTAVTPRRATRTGTSDVARFASRAFSTHSRLSLASSSLIKAEAAARPSQASSSSASSSIAANASSSYSDGGPATPGVTSDAESRAVYITWASGITSKFHNIWLRDHCRCTQCYHSTTKQRLLNTFEIAPDAKPISAEATTEGLVIQWPLLPSERAASTSSPPASAADASSADPSNPNAAGAGTEAQHTSLYPWRWLMRNSYSALLSDPITASSDESGLKGIEKVLWGKGIGSAPPTVKFDEVMQSEQGVLKWVTKIAQYGFAFVTGVPPTPTDTEALIRRIAFIRETHYGGFWDFTSDLAHGDTAYTDLALQAHTDTTYFSDPAGLQMFHLLSHTASKSGSPSSSGGSSSGSASGSGSGSSSSRGPSGGESLLVDGFLAAAVLKDVHPDAYETLSRVRIRTHSAGDENTMIRPLLDGGYPILQHDEATGELVLVRYNNDDRSVLRVDAEDVEPFYDALRKWHEILTNPEGEYWVQLKPGTAMIFDNHRVLHGRSAFVGNRRLCGAYVNHDDYRSRLAVLRAQFAENRSARGVWDDGL
ncbi:potential gamma-butyrobetaine hydroxylase [Pseudozyma hubeiensis SY62]|uniref:trimethyllysine dioxygenase n=1 Tax=Pseudozyma hubeiensis (strain SY62) TaxID=1305764 RepID=R9P4W2_PSEHS|nr:potential gamma-butyrobetaine hydroxylase [Pseudozyma hubeiensis SY62]GAC93155.1 potential gamma-butyrobetaine hydroxylase [Pseudozyma hubeiensis SY62]